MGVLWESEGQHEVASVLDDIWRHKDVPPGLMFYDQACKRRRHLLAHPDLFWSSTVNIVDRCGRPSNPRQKFRGSIAGCLTLVGILTANLHPDVAGS